MSDIRHNTYTGAYTLVSLNIQTYMCSPHSKTKTNIQYSTDYFSILQLVKCILIILSIYIIVYSDSASRP